MLYQSILFGVTDNVARLTFNRPHKLNSFSLEMHEEIRAALSSIRGDESVRALLITGAGRGFCAGQDLSARHVARDQVMPDVGQSLDGNFNPLIRSLRALEIPVIAAVNGVAAGAGANLALACDIAIAARSASFLQAFVKIGLIPDCGGTYFLPRLIGEARARALCMLGEKISAADAAAWGMIWRCVDDDELLAEAHAIAARLAAGPTRALALIKRALNEAQTNSLDQQLDLERDLQRIAGRTSDFREGVSAFLEKRAAQFHGR